MSARVRAFRYNARYIYSLFGNMAEKNAGMQDQSNMLAVCICPSIAVLGLLHCRLNSTAARCSQIRQDEHHNLLCTTGYRDRTGQPNSHGLRKTHTTLDDAEVFLATLRTLPGQ